MNLFFFILYLTLFILFSFLFAFSFFNSIFFLLSSFQLILNFNDKKISSIPTIKQSKKSFRNILKIFSNENHLFSLKFF